MAPKKAAIDTPTKRRRGRRKRGVGQRAGSIGLRFVLPAVLVMGAVALLATFWLGAPLLGIGFVAGIAISLIQITTSIQDTAFNTVPRLAGFKSSNKAATRGSRKWLASVSRNRDWRAKSRGARPEASPSTPNV